MSEWAVSAVVQFESDSKVRRPVVGRSLERWLLREIERDDPALSRALHEPDRFKPFTLSPVTPGDSIGGRYRWWMRVTSMEDTVSGWLRTVTLEQLGGGATGVPRVIDMDGLVLRPVAVTTDAAIHPWASQHRLEDLARWEGGNSLPQRLRLRFHTPTAFGERVGERTSNQLFPLPRLVFTGLGRKWNRYGPLTISDEELARFVSAVRVEAYSLESTAVKFVYRAPRDGHRGRGIRLEKGCVGWVDYSVGQDDTDEHRALLRLLGAFAFYAGVGMRTTMGLGQVTAETVHGNVSCQ